MSNTTPQSVHSECRKYVKSIIIINIFNTFNNVVERLAEHATEIFLKAFPGWKVVNPLRLCRDLEEITWLSERKKYAIEMGRDIEALLQCDAYVYVEGLGNESVGCKIEESTVDYWNTGHPQEHIDKYTISGDLITKR